MALIGPRDTRQLVMMTGWDATELKNFELEDGTTFDRVVAEMNAALGALNGELFADPRWSGMVSYTDQLELEYRVGVSNGMERHTEYGRPDSQRADMEGHMLPLIAYDRGLGWTWDYLRHARMPQIQNDIADGIKDIKDRVRLSILTRALQRGDDSGKANGLGSSGYSTGFATTAANTNVDFVPPAFEGTSFSNTHEHYVASASDWAAGDFQDIYDELREHGHQPPFDVLVSDLDRVTIEALTGFVKVVDPLIQLGITQERAVVDANVYFGTINHCRVAEVRGIPDGYGIGYKSYGPNSQRNPFRIRLGKNLQRPTAFAMVDPRAGGGAYPLQYMMLFLEFGVGVADRTAGTPRRVGNGTWADGTPT